MKVKISLKESILYLRWTTKDFTGRYVGDKSWVMKWIKSYIIRLTPIIQEYINHNENPYLDAENLEKWNQSLKVAPSKGEPEYEKEKNEAILKTKFLEIPTKLQNQKLAEFIPE